MSSSSPMRTNSMSAPFTFQVPTNVTTSTHNHETPDHYVQPSYDYQQSISSHTSPTLTPYHGQPAVQHSNQNLHENNLTTYLARPSVSYPDTIHTLSPHHTSQYNPTSSPFHHPSMNEQNTASNFGRTYFPQPDHSSPRAVSPTRQDSNSGRNGTPQRPQYNPTAAPFSSSGLNGHNTAASPSDVRVQDANTATYRGISVIRLAPPPGRRIQHSPPRRAFHESTSPPKTPRDLSDVRMREWLKTLHEKRKQALADFCFSGKAVVKSQKRLDDAWDSDVANQHLNELFVMQHQLTVLQKQHDEYGKEWKRLGEEIDELFGDMMVPGESEVG